MAEAINGMRSSLAVENISGFTFTPDGKSYLQSTPKGYLIYDLSTGKSDTLLSYHQLSLQQPSLKRPYGLSYQENGAITLRDGSGFYFFENQKGTYKLTPWAGLPKEAQNVVVLNKQNAVLYTKANNLYILKDGKEKAITSETSPHIISGQSVHRNEFGISGGIFTAEQESKVAFYRMDESMVKDYPVIDWSKVPAENKNIKYPMAGSTSHQVTLGIYDISQEQTVFLEIEGDKEQYLTSVTLSPDEKSIFVGVLNRDQNHLKLNQYDTRTGKFLKTLFEERSDKYVEPQNPLSFFPGSTTDFIWQSQRSGYNHLYHYHVDKGLVGALTKGEYLVSELLGFNAKKMEVYFVSTKDTPLERHLYKVNWNTYRMEKLSREPGMHSFQMSPGGEWIYDSYSNATTPRKIVLHQTSTGKTRTLLSSADPLKNYLRPEVRSITLQALDGTPLYGKIVLPTDFDPKKKYPVVVYLYNGPHLQLITNSFPQSGNLWYEYMAQRGYIVFSMDGRGSSGRGLKFEQAVFRDMGTLEMEDQLQGVRYLKSLPYVDSSRMGVHGWSYGGFMTTSLMLRHPDVFRVGVAGGPVIDWSMYEVMYTERYMDSPQQNPEGYNRANLLSKVENLKGKLLLIHGAQDDVVVWQHSINFLKAAVDKGVQLDYFVYPGHAHNVIGKDRVHLMEKVTEYFDAHLKP